MTRIAPRAYKVPTTAGIYLESRILSGMVLGGCMEVTSMTCRMLVCLGLAASLCVGFSVQVRADEAADAAEAARAKLVNEGELAQWLVKVLGLSRFLPAAPTDFECMQILMQNNIAPSDGWQQERPVTLGALARIVVQALGRQGEVSPDEDQAYVSFLKSIGIDFGTIGEAIENLEPLPQPVGPEAIVTSTDPLGKLARINPPDNQQIGADLSTLGRVGGISVIVITEDDLEQVQRVITQVQEPDRPEPLTPN